MRVSTETVTVYTFTKEEMNYLIELSIWSYLNARLWKTERIEVE